MSDLIPQDLPSNVIRLPVRRRVALQNTGTNEPSARELWAEVQARVKPSLRVVRSGLDLPRPLEVLPPAEVAPKPTNPDPWTLSPFDPQAIETNPRLAIDYGLGVCLRDGVLPLRKTGGQTLVVMRKQKKALFHQRELERMLGPISVRFVPQDRIEALILAKHGHDLARDAETRAPLKHSARGWNSNIMVTLTAILTAAIAVGLTFAPVAVGLVGLGLATLSFVLCITLEIFAAVASLRPQPPSIAPSPDKPLPRFSVIVALYRESDIAERLVRRLARLEYPRHLLEIILAVEEDDRLTRDVLASANLPAWMRIVVVPDGAIKTKPRALNFALNLCQGDIVGVYDAEDAPDPLQLRVVARHFMTADPKVACLQGALDFYNPRRNWLSRCFTLEYGSWFRVLLPGMARLGLVVPLGGTTLFFRKEILEKVGAWDAHNVTEDAELGLRLYRHGYRTELVATTTYEEANCRVLSWVKQRSRWIKGYMMTWAVHMRDPVSLWRDLGTMRFLALQVQFFCPLMQFLLAPIFWSLLLLPLGLPHPLITASPDGTVLALCLLFLLSEITAFLIGLLAQHRSGQSLSRLWLVTLLLYYPLASFAAFKAAWEMIRNPFYWDKTSHGAFSTASA